MNSKAHHVVLLNLNLHSPLGRHTVIDLHFPKNNVWGFLVGVLFFLPYAHPHLSLTGELTEQKPLWLCPSQPGTLIISSGQRWQAVGCITLLPPPQKENKNLDRISPQPQLPSLPQLLHKATRTSAGVGVYRPHPHPGRSSFATVFTLDLHMRTLTNALNKIKQTINIW